MLVYCRFDHSVLLALCHVTSSRLFWKAVEPWSVVIVLLEALGAVLKYPSFPPGFFLCIVLLCSCVYIITLVYSTF